MSDGIHSRPEPGKARQAALGGLKALAELKRLPEDFLRALGWKDFDAGAVGIPYKDVNGVAVRWRIRNPPGREPKFAWGRGQGLLPYGLWQPWRKTDTRTLIIVEGETDSVACWLAGLPALGVPGADCTGCLVGEDLDGFDALYLHREPDASGERFIENLLAQVSRLQWEGTAYEFSTSPPFKDPADLYADDPERFYPRLQERLALAVQILPCPERAAPVGGRRTLPFPAAAPSPAASADAGAAQVVEELAELPAVSGEAGPVEAPSENRSTIVGEPEGPVVLHLPGAAEPQRGEAGAAPSCRATPTVTEDGCTREVCHDAPPGSSASASPAERHPYKVEGGRICRQRPGQDGELEPLCNFGARIVREVWLDDGSGPVTIHFELKGKLSDGADLPTVRVLAADFKEMTWVDSLWGARPIVEPVQGAERHLRTAIKKLSAPVRRETVYTHSGWHRLAQERVYLHAAGAIGAEGVVENVQVELPDALKLACLPDPLERQDLPRAIKESLAILNLTEAFITAPLLSAVYRAVLGPCGFSVYLSGPTMVFKSSLAALAQAHWGAGFDKEHLPGNFSSTANAIAALQFVAKDMLVVVDDFQRGGAAGDWGRMDALAERVLRSQGNHAARGRCQQDGGLRASKPPRGSLLVTGEDLPHGQSLNARLLNVPIAPGQIDKGKLKACQDAAAEGLFVLALAGYVQWLARRTGDEPWQTARAAAELRGQFKTCAAPPRTLDTLAELKHGLAWFLVFALQVGAITEREAERWLSQAQRGLIEAGRTQAEHNVATDPVELFFDMLRSALATGQAYVAGRKGTWPEENAEAWGWRRPTTAGPMSEAPSFYERGEQLVGWLVDEDVFLSPNPAFAVVEKLLRSQGETLGIAVNQLGKRLKDRGLLVNWDKGEAGRGTLNRRIAGKQVKVWHLSANRLAPPPEPLTPGEPGAPGTPGAP